MLGANWKRIGNSIRNMLFGRTRRRAKRNGKWDTALRGECLEQRQLLSANQITYDPTARAIVIEGTAGGDNAQVWVDSSNLVQVKLDNLAGGAVAAFPKSSVTQIRFFGGDGDDRFTNGTDIVSYAWGDAGNDEFIGGTNSNFFSGGSGDDRLFGNISADSLDGGDGNDQLFGRAGDDYLVAGTGNDGLYGDDGNDLLLGQDGADYFEGGAGNDTLWGGAGDDYMSGGLGNDGLYGEDGNDQLFGDDGADKLDGGADNDTIWGGAGDDYMLGGLGKDGLYGQDGNDQLFGDDGADYLDGGAGNDRLFGRAGDDYIVGGVGDDGLYGDDGNDQLFGQDGADYFEGGAGDDTIWGGAGDDYMLGGVGKDALYGQDGNDQLFGDDGADYLDGGAGNDRLFGRAGDDYIVGGAGDDGLYGDDGNDQLLGQDGADYFEGGAGSDTIWGGAGIDYMLGGAGDDALYGQDDNDQLFGDDGNDYLDGGTGDDVLRGGLGDNYMVGGAGNDGLYGQDGNDRLYGDDGNDYLYGGDGNDSLWGGAGDDYIEGGAGSDGLEGGDGNDYLLGQDGADYLNAGAGDDWLVGGAGDDYLLGGSGNNRLYGNDGNDNLNGESGDDLLDGGAGNDSIAGGAGDDGMFGGAGNDNIFGNEGNDYLVGGDGNDALSGGSGNDVLIGGAGIDQVNGDGNDDILIGGTTIYDNDADKLRTLARAWALALPYLTRTLGIENELFAAHLESNETVFDDQVADALYGAGGEDWFFMTGYLGTYVPNDVAHAHDEEDDSTSGHHKQVIVHQVPKLEGFEFIDSLDKLVDRQSTESVHTLVPHVDSPTLQREHLSLYQLVRYDAVTNYAVRSGAWSDPATWKNGQVPKSGARVLIPMGVNVEIDGVIQARMATIRVDGKLSFIRSRNTELRVDTVIVTDSGSFEMGTQTAPIVSGFTARLLITDNGAIDRTWDPFGISRGLISHGSVSIYGTAISSYAGLAGSAAAGAKSITLRDAPYYWKIGDTIVVAATTEGATQNETRKIVGVSHNTILLDRPLNFNHVSAASGLDIHVENLFRNAVIESESTVIERRGHVMFMHNRDVHIGYAGFYHLGRTNKLVPVNDPVVGSDWKLQPGTGTNPRGRYAVHFHRNGTTNDGNPATIIGSAVVDSPGWGFVNHSGYVEMTNNVAFDVHGAAFATEVGDEIGSFIGNLAIGSTGSGEGISSRFQVQDFGHEGDGFWFQGAGISVTGNISAGNQAHAFVYYTQGLFENGVQAQFLAANLADPSLAKGAKTIPIGLVPMTQFSNNVGYASSIGFQVWNHLQNSTHGGRSVVQDSKFWNNTTGVDLHYADWVTLRRLTVIHEPGNRPDFGVNTHIEGFLNFEQLTIAGYGVGLYLPRWGDNVVNGGTYFNNGVDIVVPIAFDSGGQGRKINLTGLSQQTTIQVWATIFTFPGASAEYHMVDDTVLLNFGPYVNRRLYGHIQEADAIPFPTAGPDVPNIYVGLSNQQLWDRYGVAIGNAIAPSNAITVPNIWGLIAPAL